MADEKSLFTRALLAGGAAGFAVDVSLFPIDTIKTRLQSPSGFAASGGFNGVYRGLGAAAAGSVPGAALFFSAYEGTKHRLGAESVWAQVAAACVGELFACSVRVPVEVVKQQQQAGQVDRRMLKGAGEILKQSGVGGFYRGFGATIGREVPFAAIQMPLLEAAKTAWTARRDGEPLTPAHVAACGSVCGGFAAGLTTPLDVVKTRLMLGADARGVPYDRGAAECFTRIVADEGAAALMSGLSARVFWISLGGFLFFGAYDAATTGLVNMGV
mmetsp:Transcript_27863/g.83608  ORF Transcript_27863/g.83608 Transcript_27863/m.83608 type:complete len:272 (+) Transcript_27863:404-1219(+)